MTADLWGKKVTSARVNIILFLDKKARSITFQEAFSSFEFLGAPVRWPFFLFLQFWTFHRIIKFGRGSLEVKPLCSNWARAGIFISFLAKESCDFISSSIHLRLPPSHLRFQAIAGILERSSSEALLHHRARQTTAMFPGLTFLCYNSGQISWFCTLFGGEMVMRTSIYGGDSSLSRSTYQNTNCSVVLVTPPAINRI